MLLNSDMSYSYLFANLKIQIYNKYTAKNGGQTGGGPTLSGMDDMPLRVWVTQRYLPVRDMSLTGNKIPKYVTQGTLQLRKCP